MTDAFFKAHAAICDKHGIASFDAAAGFRSDPPPRARNAASELLGYLMMKLENAHMTAYIGSRQCNEKSFDQLKTNLDNMARRLDINTLRDQIDEIVTECRDVSREREEHLLRELRDAKASVRELMREVDQLKRQTCLVGPIRQRSWPDSAQDPI